MGLYQKFLNFEVVVNIKTEAEWKAFVERCKQLKINSRWMDKTSFHDLHTNAGILVMKYGEVCIEYTMSKGMTFDKKQNYVNYGCNVCTVNEFLEATK